MRYYVTIGARTYEVDITADGVTVDGDAVAVELLQVGHTPLRRLSVNGESHRLVAERGGEKGQWDLHLDGLHVTAEVVDERTRAIRALTAPVAGAQGPRPVKAPMPGMIVRVEVQVGDRVSAGQGVVIIEAMKMENELKATAAGTVSKVAVTAGTAVEKGTVLIEFAADE
jgi:biotin carboxyl carrier protein